MTANLNPIFTLTPNVGVAQATAANTNRDGTGTIYTCFTAGANGSRVFRINAKAIVTTTAGMVRIYIYTGAVYKLLREYPVSAITVAANVKSWEVEEAFYDLVLPTGYTLVCSTHNAESMSVVCWGGDF
jgi:hypothetical protein